MTKKYYAIPLLVYVPVDVVGDAENAHHYIKLPINQEAPEALVFLAEDYTDGVVEVDPLITEFSGMITVDCDESCLHPNRQPLYPNA